MHGDEKVQQADAESDHLGLGLLGDSRLGFRASGFEGFGFRASGLGFRD